MNLRAWEVRALLGAISLLFTILSAVGVYIATQLSKLSDSVNELNTRFAVSLVKTDNLGIMTIDHESRIRALEARMRLTNRQ